jgi:large subunit ribosomal protein L19
MNLLKDLEKAQLRTDHPRFQAGDTVRVYSRIREGEKERVQYFEGIVIGFHRNGLATTFKVRKESYGVGVERTYPLHSPLIEKIVVKRRGDVRRAKLYFLRGVSGKKARIREKRDWISGKGAGKGAAKAAGTAAKAAEEPAGAEGPPETAPTGE